MAVCIGTACTIVDRGGGNPGAGDYGAQSACTFSDTGRGASRRRLRAGLIRVTRRFGGHAGNVLESGIPNAIKIFNEVIVPLGFRPKGVRIDSGDIAYLSRKSARDAG